MKGTSSIRLSKKHGFNPTMGVCFYCHGEDGTIGLLGRLNGDVEAPRHAVISKKPCASCLDHMKLGILFVEVENDPYETCEPRPTGSIWVLKEDFVRAQFADPVRSQMLATRMAFIPRNVAEVLGLREKKV